MRRLLLLVPLVLAACGDDGGDPVVAAAPDADAPLRAAHVTVLESPDHGPQLCTSVAESYPPQCGGPDLIGWSWDDVDDEESANGTTWTSASVTGTWDGESLTVTDVGPPEAFEDDGGHDFTPLCEDFDPDAPTSYEGVRTDDIDGVAAAFVSDPSGDQWDGPLVFNVVAVPGKGDAVRAAVEARWAGPLCVVERDQPSEAELLAVQDEAMSATDAPWGQADSGFTDALRGVVVVGVFVADDEARQYAADRWGDLVELEATLEPVEPS